MSLPNSINIICNSLTPAFKTFLMSSYNNYKLPSEVWYLILEHLSPQDLYNFMYSNKIFLKIVLSNANALSLNFKKTLSTYEEKWLFHYGISNNQSALINNVKFMSAMSIINFTNIDTFDIIYNNNNILAGSNKLNNGLSREIAAQIINATQVISLYNAKIRYGLLKTFFQDKFKINPLMFYIIKFANSEILYNMFIIMMKFPELIDTLHINNMKRINFFFHNQYKTNKLTIEKVVEMIAYACHFDGKSDNALIHLANPIRNSYQLYIELLICGVKEIDANCYARTRYIEPEQLLTFKALVPIIGYYYANAFYLGGPYAIYLERPLDFEEYPYFVEVASKMNSLNIFCIEQCLRFSKTGGNIDKLLTLRNRKRM